MQCIDKKVSEILDRLACSKFRAGFGLDKKDIVYIKNKGMERIKLHAKDFVITRLAAKNPKSDGRQTPFKGHPVFKAQHAVAACCRNCLKKWHKIPKNRELRIDEIEFIVELIMNWIYRQQERAVLNSHNFNQVKI